MCNRCVMPESKPHITLDGEGTCTLCREYNSTPGQEPLETDFIRLLKAHKGKGKYDCLVMCSGGKDSTSALYYMKKRYKLNPLAFMFDHGFESKEAIANVKSAVERLGVDLVFHESDYMHDLFSEMLRSGSRAVVCHPCSMWYMGVAFDMAAKHKIPIIIAGWTKGQSTRQGVMTKCGCNAHSAEFAEMARESAAFLKHYTKKNPKYKTFPKSMEEVLKRAKKKHKSIVLSPHWFLPFDNEEKIRVITEECGWKPVKRSYPANTTNCRLNFVSVHNSMRDYGYTHYHVEMSKLIRQGLMTREQALKDLEITFDKELLNSIAQKLDYRFD